MTTERLNYKQAMGKLNGLIFLCSSVVVLSVLLLHAAGDDRDQDNRKIYIVYMGAKPSGDLQLTQIHDSMLKKVVKSYVSTKDSLVYSYRSFNAFAAKMTEEEAQSFADMGEVLAVIPNHIFDLHTTKSWDFIGLPNDAAGLDIEADVIIGVLDTGIWPEHESFSDDGLKAPPSRWKGKCASSNFTCNNKIIGARYYSKDSRNPRFDLYKSPRDDSGHGTHTASVVAGASVTGAGFSGLATGTARGGVPGARIAVYKVCWFIGCASANILAGFDDAIADGVDIISASIGSREVLPYLEDAVALGAFHAMRQGILTSSSAGSLSFISNFAPWILTVAASTINRKFISQLVLGNGHVINGRSINGFNLNGTNYPLIWGGDAANYSAGFDPLSASSCLPRRLNSEKISGKIVMCGVRSKGFGVLQANGTGFVVVSDDHPDVAFHYELLPTTTISSSDAQIVMEYIRSSNNPIATILVSQTPEDVVSPSVASLSSRGPNPISPNILKPDITAPGVNILAAWLLDGSIGNNHFNIISGTSVSCAHVSGAGAYIKASHPTWSPAAIKSALMTTATVVDPRKHNDLEFAYGSGQINPQKALDPGLVYDAQEGDYINFLCKKGYNDTTIRFLTGDNSTSCNNAGQGRGWDLNYPSFSVAVEDGNVINASLIRTVTNVGSANSTYTVKINSPSLFEISVVPTTLDFSSTGDKRNFTLAVVGPKISQQPIMSGSIVWSDGVHQVRSPVVVYTVLPGATFMPIKSSVFQVRSEPKNRLKWNPYEIPSQRQKHGSDSWALGSY